MSEYELIDVNQFIRALPPQSQAQIAALKDRLSYEEWHAGHAETPSTRRFAELAVERLRQQLARAELNDLARRARESGTDADRQKLEAAHAEARALAAKDRLRARWLLRNPARDPREYDREAVWKEFVNAELAREAEADRARLRHEYANRF